MQKKSGPNKVNLSVMVLLLIGQFDTIKFGAPGGHWRLTFDLSKDEIRCSFTWYGSKHQVLFYLL